jgi:hypothetical protein
MERQEPRRGLEEPQEIAPEIKDKKMSDTRLEAVYGVKLSPSNQERLDGDTKRINAILRSLYKPKRELPKSNKEVTSLTYGDEISSHYQLLEDAHKKRVTQITTNFTDFVPIVGSIKMFVEGVKGKQFGTGKPIKGFERFVHTLSGGVFLALDVTGAGVIISEVGKGLVKVGTHVAIEGIEKGTEAGLFRKEVGKLAARGEKRVERQKEIEGVDR